VHSNANRYSDLGSGLRLQLSPECAPRGFGSTTTNMETSATRGRVLTSARVQGQVWALPYNTDSVTRTVSFLLEVGEGLRDS
jgi:hypothetical protein